MTNEEIITALILFMMLALCLIVIIFRVERAKRQLKRKVKDNGNINK